MARDSRQWLVGSARPRGRSTVASQEYHKQIVARKPQVHTGKPIGLL